MILLTLMAKMAALASTNSKNKLLGVKEDKFWKNDDDRISQIPDEVLVSILSLLTMKEAARTSVLSRRWERLWTFYTGSLNFDATQTLFSLQPVTETGLLEHAQRNKYVGWVNQVLTSLDGSSSIVLEEFKVRFDLDKYYSRHIDRWIEFVMERRVRKVELDFEPILSDFRCTSMRSYTFPVEFNYARVKEPRGLYNISALTSLCLKYVDVSREVIEFLLSNCPLLERLCVVASEKLLNLKVTGGGAAATTLQLKYLEVSKCFNLKSLEISSAPNLLALKYVGQRIILQVENVPRLVEVSIGRENIISYMVGFLSSYLSQLETLVLDFNILAEGVFRQYFPLTNLKHLILRVEADYDPSIIGWTSLIEASPLLQKFTLELFSAKRSNWKRGFQKVTESSSPHQCLKVVRFVGFIGCTTEVELAMYFFQNASMLEKIVIDHRHPSLIGTPLEFEIDRKKRSRAKKHAEKLKRILPRKVALVFI